MRQHVFPFVHLSQMRQISIDIIMKKRNASDTQRFKFFVKIMKAYALLAVITLTRLSAFEVSGQLISIDMQNVELSKILHKIEQESQYRFFYSNNLVDVNTPYSIRVKDAAIEVVLEVLFADKPISYRFLDQQIVLYPDEGQLEEDPSNATVDPKKVKPLALISRDQIKALETQQRSIRGVVTDEDGIPLSGVNIIEKNTTNGVVTDFDGAFQIYVQSDESILIFSYLGFETYEIEVSEQDNIEILMTSSVNELEEVVLSTGYQEISKERTTGSFQQIKDEVLDIKIAQNILNKVEGEVSGILFDQQDGPIIRGLSTINANNDPLIVVDGFPITQGLNSINPNSIKDITVLKDAAAASIWGIRAANGVIVIVTKKGDKSKAPSIEFSTNYAVTAQKDLHDLPYASTESFLEFEKHLADNNWEILPAGRNQPPHGLGLQTYLQLANGLISQAEADNIINGLRTIDSRQEFEEHFMDHEYWRQYNVDITGGGEKNSYRASIVYNINENEGFYRENKSDEIIASLRNSFDLNDQLTLNTDLNFTSGKRYTNGMRDSDYRSLHQYQKILDNQGNYLPQVRGLAQQYKETKVDEGYPYNWDYNLKQEFDNKDNLSRATSFRFQTALQYKINEFLNLKGSYQYEWLNINATSLMNENTYFVRNMANTYTTYSTDQEQLVTNFPLGSVLTRNNDIERTHQGRLQLAFDKEFQEGLHKISALAGYEMRQELQSGSTNTLYGYDPQSLTSANVAFGERVPVTPFGTRTIDNPNRVREREDRFISYYANTRYTFDHKYTLTGSIRLDDTNLFGASNEYRNIPLYSIGGKWDLYKEDFVKNDIFSLLALRLTYGVNGNSDNGTSPFLQTTVSRNTFLDLLFSYISDIKNPELRLEKVYVTNLGLDFGIFDNRLTGTIEYYNRRSEDLLAPVSFPSVYGFNNAIINAGEMENRGIDVNLNLQVTQAKAIKYNTVFNFSYNENEVTNVDTPEETINTYLNGEPLVNLPLRYLYSYRFAGLDSNGYPQFRNENGQIVNVNGETDVNGTLENAPIHTPDALEFNGTTTPKYYGSWVNNISYKNIFFRSLITFKLGHVFRNTDFLDIRNESFKSNRSNIHKDYENRWKNPGDENNTSIPRFPTLKTDASRPGYSYYVNGNQWVDSASHIRFREIILGYRFQEDVLNKIKLQDLSLSIQARNLGLINFNKWDKDPESILFPVSPTFTFNLSAKF